MSRKGDAEGAQFAGLGPQDRHGAQDNADALFSIHGIPADLYKYPPGYNEESQLVPYGPDAKLIDRFDCRLLLDPGDIETWTRSKGVNIANDITDEHSSEDEAVNHLRYCGLNGPEDSSIIDGAGEEDDYSYGRNEYGSVPFSYNENIEGNDYSIAERDNLLPPPAPLAPSILKQQCDNHAGSVGACWGPATLRQMAIISLVAKYIVKLGDENKCNLSEFQEEIGMYGEFGFLSPEHSQHGIFLIMLKQWKKNLTDKETIAKGEENDLHTKIESNPLQMILDYGDEDEEKPTEPNESKDADMLSARDAAVKGFLRQYCISHGVDEIQKIDGALRNESSIYSDKFSSLFLQVKEEVKHMKEHRSVQLGAKFDQTPTNKAPENPQTDTKRSTSVRSKDQGEDDIQEDLLSDKNQACLPDEKLQALRRAKAQSLLRKRQLEVQQKTKSRRENFVQQSELDRQKKMAAIGQHKQMFLDSDSD